MIKQAVTGNRVWHPLYGKGTITGKWTDSVQIHFDQGEQQVISTESILLFNVDEWTNRASNPGR